MEPELPEEYGAELGATSARFGATGTVFTVTVNGGKTFTGKAGGLSIPGTGALFGDVYTDNLGALSTPEL